MTAYTPIIRYLLLWQLILPVLMVLAPMGWLWAVVTSGLFAVLFKSKSWESNSYSKYGALAVVISAAIYAIGDIVNGSFGLPTSVIFTSSPLQIAHTSINTSWVGYGSMVVWLFSMVAFTATSPYPLGIRMPVVVYTVFYFLVGDEVARIAPAWIVIAAVVFAAMMLLNLALWRQQYLNRISLAKTRTTSNQTTDISISQCASGGTGTPPAFTATLTGPPEPPFSLTLATAIPLVLVIALIEGVSGLWWHSPMQKTVPLILISCVVVWVLCAKDWKKNPLATSALVLILVSNAVSTLSIYNSQNLTLKALAFILAIAPTMFHTTAPVFRGMRVTITLYVIYNAFCKPTIKDYLMEVSSDIPNFASLMFIAFDAVILLTLLLMAMHWKRTTKLNNHLIS